MPLAVLANRDPQFDSIAALLLTIGVVQFVHYTMHGRFIAGLRAAVIGVALVLTMITPWILTLSIAAGALLVVLYLADTHRIPSYRRP